MAVQFGLECGNACLRFAQTVLQFGDIVSGHGGLGGERLKETGILTNALLMVPICGQRVKSKAALGEPAVARADGSGVWVKAPAG